MNKGLSFCFKPTFAVLLGRIEQSWCFRASESCMFDLPPCAAQWALPRSTVRMLLACNGAWAAARPPKTLSCSFHARGKGKAGSSQGGEGEPPSRSSAPAQAGALTAPTPADRGQRGPVEVLARCLAATWGLCVGAQMLPGALPFPPRWLPPLPLGRPPLPPQPLRRSHCRRSLSFI